MPLPYVATKFSDKWILDEAFENEKYIKYIEIEEFVGRLF